MAKRKQTAPYLPPPKRRTKAELAALRSARSAATLARQARIGAILARTRAGRAQRDELAAGADMSDLAHLPVMYPERVKRAGLKGKKALAVAMPAESAERIAQALTEYVTPPIAPPITGRRRAPKTCSICGEVGHTKLSRKHTGVRTATAESPGATAAP